MGPLHPAQARDRRRQDRDPGAGGAGRRVLHAARPHRRRPADHRAAAGDRRDLAGVRARHRRHHRPAERPVPLDPDRGRARRSGERLEAVGLSTTEACGDTPARHPRLARSPGSPRTRSSTAPRPSTRSTAGSSATRTFSNLPRKFKTAISGSPLLDVAHEINDVAFVGVEPPRARPRLRRVGRRRAVHQPEARRAARRLGPAGRGRRTSGTGVIGDLPRLRLPAAAHPRPAEVPGRRLGPGEVPPGAGGRVPASASWSTAPRPTQPVAAAGATTSACTGSRTAASTSASPRAWAGSTARPSPRSPTWPRRTARAGVRTTVEQKMIVLDVDGGPGRVARRRPGGAGPARSSPSPFRRGTMACTGIEFCKLAIVETKARGASLIDELERRIPDFDEPITININGCPNACARIQVADIGLKGQLVLDDEGNQVEGYQVHLGGALGLEAGFGRKVRGLKVTADGAPRLRRAGRSSASRRSARTASGSPMGGAGRRSRCMSDVAHGAGRARRWRSRSRRMDGRGRHGERASRAVLLPVLRRRGPASARGRGTAPGNARPATGRSS